LLFISFFYTEKDYGISPKNQLPGQYKRLQLYRYGCAIMKFVEEIIRGAVSEPRELPQVLALMFYSLCTCASSQFLLP